MMIMVGSEKARKAVIKIPERVTLMAQQEKHAKSELQCDVLTSILLYIWICESPLHLPLFFGVAAYQVRMIASLAICTKIGNARDTIRISTRHQIHR